MKGKLIFSMFVMAICFFTFSIANVNAKSGESILEKQKEIDKYIFETNSEEIAEKGITVTHTGPLENAVEIGITPFNEANASYFYKIFGEDNIKVVEGTQAVTLMAGNEAITDTSTEGPVISTTVYKTDDDSNTITWITMISMMVIMSIIFLSRKRKC